MSHQLGQLLSGRLLLRQVSVDESLRHLGKVVPLDVLNELSLRPRRVSDSVKLVLLFSRSGSSARVLRTRERAREEEERKNRMNLISHPTQNHTLNSHRPQILRELGSLLVLLYLLHEPIDVLDPSEVAVLVHPFYRAHDLLGRDLGRISQISEDGGRFGVEAYTRAEEFELSGVGGVGDGRVGEDGVGLEEGGFERSLDEKGSERK